MKKLTLVTIAFLMTTTAYSKEIQTEVDQTNKKLWIATLKLKAEMQGKTYEQAVCNVSKKYYKQALTDQNADTLLTAAFLLDQCMIERARSAAKHSN